jgi:hypothetical protein
MHRWLSALLGLALLVIPGTQTAHAQISPACGNQILNTVLPVLQSANRFNPGGIFPAGYWPLTQPFGSNPNEAVYTGYPTSAYYSSYAVPGWAQQNPQLYPGAYPQNSVLPGLYPPDLTGQVGAQPNGDLTSAAILQRLQSDGTFDRLSPTEQADWLFRLASLQRDEINQRFTQASLQQNAENTVLNLRRAPIDVSIALQNRASDWRNAYNNYASTLALVLQQSNCGFGNATATGGSAVPAVPTAPAVVFTGTPIGGVFPSQGACLAAGNTNCIAVSR